MGVRQRSMAPQLVQNNFSTSFYANTSAFVDLTTDQNMQEIKYEAWK
jgi:hypothetical protein